MCRLVDLSGRKPSCDPFKTDRCSSSAESLGAHLPVTILAVFMRQIGRIDPNLNIISCPTLLGMSVSSQEAGILPPCSIVLTAL